MTVSELIAMLSDQPLAARVQFTNIHGVYDVIEDSAVLYSAVPGPGLVELLIR